MAADGTITFKTELDNKLLEKQYKDLEKKVKKIEEDVKKSDEKKSKLQEMFEEAAAAAEKTRGKIKGLKDELARLQQVKTGQVLEGNTPNQQIEAMMAAEDKIPGVQAQIKEATAEYNKQVSEVDKLSAKLDAEETKHAEITGQLEETSAAAGDVRIQIEKAGKYKGLVNMLEQAKKKAGAVLNRINKLAARVFVFTMITRALRGIREFLGEVISQDAEAMHAINSLKGALLTLATPIIQVVIPAFTKFVNILAVLISYMARGVSAIFGKSIEDTIAAAKKLTKGTKEEEKGIKAVGKAAKGASRYLAGFDELNLAAGGSDSGSNSGTDNSALEKLNEAASEGANWDAFDLGKLEDKFTELDIFIGSCLLALGAILAFSGLNIPLGLTLMMIGAMMIAGAVGEKWNELPEKTKKAINTILELTGITMIVIGLILALSGVNLPVGIGLIAAGAVLLGIEAALNWDTVKKFVQEHMKVIMIVGIVAVVLGLLLCLTGVALPVGIALIALGAAALVGAAALNWNTLKEKLPENLDSILQIAGTVAIVLGLILICTGVGIGLGVALLMLGVAAWVGAVAINWDFIKEKVEEIWNGVKSFWDEHIKQIFTAEWWTNKFSTISEGLKSAIKSGINAAIALLNTFIEWANDKLHLQWDEVNIGGKTIIPAADFQLFKLPTIPQLAQGAVIPPNRTFLAELGDQTSGNNLETPEGLMRQIVREETGNGEILNVLQSILSAVEDGHVIMVDRRVLGQVTKETLNNMVRMGGTA